MVNLPDSAPSPAKVNDRGEEWAELRRFRCLTGRDQKSRHAHLTLLDYRKTIPFELMNRASASFDLSQ
jgi:hypothetical protein